MNKEQRNLYKNKVKGCVGGGSFSFGIGLMILGTGGAISIITNDGDFGAAIFALGIMTLPGWFLTRKAYRAMKESMLQEKIYGYLKAKKKMALEDLAQKANARIETVTDQVVKMIANGMIDGFINDMNEIVLNGEEKAFYEEVEEQEVTVVKCSACGATNKVKVGTPTECEYCGTMLNAMK